MSVHFAKYHGAQNDFILINNITGHITEQQKNKMIALCHRRSGIGADGLLLLEKSADEFAYKMRYLNPDGNEVAFCGNGARCLYQFALDEQVVNDQAYFIAGDGQHIADKSPLGVKILMSEVKEFDFSIESIQKIEFNYGLYNTGVDHLVIQVDDVGQTDLIGLGKKYRPNGVVLPGGLNVNIFEFGKKQVKVRTYERGVEAETMACGTGNVAVAYHIIKNKLISDNEIFLYPPGGELKIEFPNGISESPWLHGEAVKVYSGIVK